jgi:hypothetical protein
VDGGKVKATVQYPELTKRRKLLRCLFRELRNAHARGVSELRLRFHARPTKYKQLWRREPEVVETFRWLGVYVDDSSLNIAEELGLDAAECISLIETLATTGYLGGYRRPVGRPNARGYIEDLDREKENQTRWISHLTDSALREIGELPDPHADLMQRLDVAILQIQQDQRLNETQKRQTISWLEEGKIVARTLTIDAIKAILAGAVS